MCTLDSAAAMLHYIIQWKRLNRGYITNKCNCYKPNRSEAKEPQTEILWKQLNKTSDPWLWRWFWSSELSTDWLVLVHQCPTNAYWALALHVCVFAHSPLGKSQPWEHLSLGQITCMLACHSLLGRRRHATCTDSRGAGSFACTPSCLILLHSLWLLWGANAAQL